MALLNEEFDIAELPQGNGDFQPLPAGWYSAHITSAELKNTKSGTGQYIAVRYDITGPTHQGRVVFGNLNIKNPNVTAEEIGRQQLGELMRAIGLARVQDTDQLIGGNLQIKLSIRADNGYEPSNDVKGYKTAGGGTAKQNTQSPAESKTGKSSPPWATK